MLLTVTDLVCARGGLTVLSGLSFALAPGEALQLRGPNGSGKTTLLRTLAGLQDPVSGTVAAAPETVAYAAHSDGLKAALTVEENLRFWADIHGAAEIRTALERFDLTALRDRAAGRLSAGQKRRLGLARLLLADRPVWALDEPTVSLDARSVSMFAEIVHEHCSAGGAAVIATHLDLRLEARILDLTGFRARGALARASAFDEAFL